MQQHDISSDWVAVDDSKNTLQLADTPDTTPKGDKIIAMRDTFETDRPPLFLPAAHIRSLVEVAQAGRLDRLLGRNR